MFPNQTIGNYQKIQLNQRELRGSKEPKKTNPKVKKKRNVNQMFLSFCISVLFELTLFVQKRGRLVIVNLKFSSIEKGFQEERKTKENGSEILAKFKGLHAGITQRGRERGWGAMKQSAQKKQGTQLT